MGFKMMADIFLSVDKKSKNSSNYIKYEICVFDNFVAIAVSKKGEGLRYINEK